MSAESAIAEPEAPLAGRYRFLRGLSSRSWLGWDERSARRVLISLVSVDEVTRLGKIRSVTQPHLARVLDVQESVPPAELPVGCDTGHGAVVTELAHGRSLAAIVHADGPLGPARAVAWTLRLARSLAVLHESGSLHGAISPAAVIQQAFGRPVSPVLTWLRALPYGPALSPEVLGGQEPTQADDVWSLCVVLYFALTGSYPFTGESSEALLGAMQRPLAPLAEQGVDDQQLQKVVDVAFARDAQRRFRSIQELLGALDAYELGEDPPARGARPPRLGLGSGVGRNLAAGLTKPAPLHKSLAGVVFDIAAVESPELLEIGPEPAQANRASGGRPSAPFADRPSAPFADRPSAPQFADRPSAPRKVPSLLPINPFQRKSRWPLVVLLVVVAAAAAGAALTLRPAPSLDKPTAVPAAPVTRATRAPSAPARPKLSKAERLRACTESYFEEGTFEAEAPLDFICQEGPLPDIVQRLYELAEAKADARYAQLAEEAKLGQPDDVVRADPRTRLRRPLGWYELLSTAIVRRSCCSPAPSVTLPKTPGWCAQLGDVVSDLAEDSARSADLAPRIKRFDKAIECLYANRTAIPYADYASRPIDDTQRAALQNFLSLAAMSEAKRRKLE